MDNWSASNAFFSYQFNYIKKTKILNLDLNFIINYLFSLIAACAAAKRAIGTMNGEQDT